MATLQEIMGNYFKEDTKKKSLLTELSVTLSVGTPITPRRFDWEKMTDPERLGKSFEFKDHHEYRSFLSEIMNYESQTGHYGKIIANFPSVHVEVYTHDVNGITDLDLEYTAEVDDIRRDVAYYVEEDE